MGYKLSDLSVKSNIKMLSFFNGTHGDAIASRLANLDLVGRYIRSQEYESIYYNNFMDDLNPVITLEDYDFKSLVDENISIIRYESNAFGYSITGAVTRRNMNDKQLIKLAYEKNIPCLIMDCFGALNREDEQTSKLRQNLLDFIKKIGYNCQVFPIDCADFGVPQHRSRLLIICTLDPTLISLKHNKPVTFSQIKDENNQEEIIDLENADLIFKDNEVCPAGPNIRNADIKIIRETDCHRISEIEWRRLVTYPDDYYLDMENPTSFYYNCLPPIYIANILTQVKNTYF